MAQTRSSHHALPIYVQIAELLTRDIVAGRLIDGERLKPEREMAAELGVSVGTLRKALRDTTLLGVGTNIDYLADIVAHPAFRSGDLHTGFVEEHAESLTPAEPDDRTIDTVLVAALNGHDSFRRQNDNYPEPYASMGHWRN